MQDSNDDPKSVQVSSCFSCSHAQFCKVLEAADKFELSFRIVRIDSKDHRTKEHLREFVAAHCARYSSILNK